MTEKETTNWTDVALVKVCDLNMGQSPSSDTYNLTGGGLPFFQGKTDFGYRYPRLRMYCTDPKKIAEPGDILMSVRAPVGPVNIANTKSCIGRGIAGLRAKKEVLDQAFLYFNLLLNEKNIASLGSGSIFQAINKSQLENYKIVFPLLSEQKTIARMLTAVQEAIVGQEELIAKLKELKQSMMQYLFTRGTKGEKTKVTEIGVVPESWEVVEIEKIGKIVTGSTPSTKKEVYYNPKEIDFIGPADIGYSRYLYSTCKQISVSGLNVSRPLPKDAVCCVCIGSSIGKVAKTYKDCSVTNQQINSIVCDDKFNADFVYYLMVFYSEYWRKHATFGPVPILSKGSFGKIKIPISDDKNEQDKLSKLFVSIDQRIEIAQEKLFSYQKLFKTLLHELMSGGRRA